jgi:hypothetical protein
MASITREEALETLEDAQAQALVGAIREMDNAEWHSKAPYRAERRAWLGMMLGSITGAPKRAFGHAFAHLPDLERYVSALRQ